MPLCSPVLNKPVNLEHFLLIYNIAKISMASCQVLERWYLYPQGAGPTAGDLVPGSRRVQKKKKISQIIFKQIFYEQKETRISNLTKNSRLNHMCKHINEKHQWLAGTLHFSIK